MSGEAFFQVTSCTPHPEIAGRYTGELTHDWVVAVVPQGGIVAALAARAMIAELAHPDQSLRSFTAFFVSQVRPGPVEIDVTVLRRGRSMSQAMATVRNVGESSGLTATAAFGAPRPGFEFTDLVMPAADPPEQCPSFRDPPPPELDWPEWEPSPFWTRVEGRAATGHAPWESWMPDTSEQVLWHRFDDPPVAADGNLDQLALLVLADAMPGAVSQRMGEFTEWFGPSVDLTVHLFGSVGPGWVLLRNRARHAGDGYASVEMELWDPASARLVAYATQQMFFTFQDGPPPPEFRVPVDQRSAADQQSA